MARALLIAPLIALAGCMQPTDVQPDCPIAGSSDWAAWVNAMPGPDRPKLIVTGKVTVPTGGWRVALEAGPIQESYPAVQRVELRATPPADAATQAVVTHEVRGSFPYEQEIGTVTVHCGPRVLATISPVEKAY